MNSKSESIEYKYLWGFKVRKRETQITEIKNFPPLIPMDLRGLKVLEKQIREKGMHRK